MPTYTFNPNPSSANWSVSWSDPSVWTGATVPNAPDADVVFPTITDLSTGYAVSFLTSIGSAQAFSIRSATISNNRLLLAGSLSVAGAFSLLQGGELDIAGGTLSLGSLQNTGTEIQGSGTIRSAGAVVNEGTIYGSDLVLDFGSFRNAGELGASGGDLTVVTDALGFSNLAGGRLTGGTYSASNGGTLRLKVGEVITTVAATITLSSGTVASYDVNPAFPRSGAYRPLEETLQAIDPGGMLAISGMTFTASNRLAVDGALTINGSAFTASNGLAVAGTVTLDGASDSSAGSVGALSAAQLAVAAGGLVQGRGIVIGQVDNGGVIAAGMVGNGGTLVVQASVTGTGSLLVSGGQLGRLRDGLNYFPGSTLELGSTVSQDVRFADAAGTLQIDAPQALTGTIVPVGAGNKVVLQGIALSSITNRTYTGDTRGGTLVLHRDAGDISLSFRGHYTAESFSLSAGAQRYSNSPPSVVVVPAAVTPHDVTGDGFGDIVWQNADGTPAVWGMQTSGGGANVGVGAYLNYQNPGSSWRLVGSADLSGDGRADLLWQNADGAPSAWLVGQGGGFVTDFPVFSNPGPSWRLVGGADLDGNGRADLLWQNANGAVSAWMTAPGGTGVGAYANFTNPGPSWHLIGAGDLNGDGHSDLVFQNDSGAVSAWLIGGTLYTPAVSTYANFSNPGPSWHMVGTGDLNGDGRDELLFQNDSGLPSAWLMGQDGTSVAGYPTFQNPGTSWHLKGATDANGDGRADLVWQNDSGQPSLWLMGAGGTSVDSYPVLDNPGAASWTIKEG